MKVAVYRAGLIAALLSTSAPALAYLDGATGSMLLQGAIGGVVTAMAFGRLYIAKVKAFFGRGGGKLDSDQVEG